MRLPSPLVLVVTSPPEAGFIASFGSSVEPMVHAEERIDAACIGRIGVVDDAVLERERAHARPVTMVSGHVGSRHGRELGLRRVAATLLTSAPSKYVARRRLAPVVVF